MNSFLQLLNFLVMLTIAECALAGIYIASGTPLPVTAANGIIVQMVLLIVASIDAIIYTQIRHYR